MPEADVLKKSVVTSLFAIGLAAMTATAVLAHGNVTPQPVDTTGLEALGEEWKEANPYRGNEKAREIGDHGYAANCAGCHGLHGVSGGMAPDLRELEVGDDGDEWFIERVRKGVIRNGKVYCPTFEGILSQEAMWAIREWLESVHVE